MHARESTFFDLVQGEKQFQIPLYQRTYSWGPEQLRPLWQDVLDLAELQDQVGRHFVGSVVMAPSPSASPSSVNRWLVVDGQQRLTTLMLTLAALRDHHAELGSDHDDDRILRQYLVNEFRTGDDRLRLLPTQADRDSYRAIVLRTPGATPSGTIAAAHRSLRTALRALGPDGPELAAIEQAVRSGLTLVDISAEPGDNVYRIFESLNNTGLQLTQADLLRNYLFMRLPTRAEDVYRDLWLPMQHRLTPANLELLFWIDVVLRGDDRVKQGDLYRAQHDRLDRVTTEDGIVAEIAELARRSRLLERVLDPTAEPDPALSEGLRHLQRWGGTTAYPLVVHLLDLLERGTTTAASVAEALSYIESFLVRRMICQVPSNNLNRTFMTAPAAVGTTNDAAGAVRTYLSQRRRYWPSDADLRSAIASRPFYWTGRSSQRFYVLRRLEESYNAHEPVDFDKAALTIEHVLPQTATAEWLDLLAGEVTDEGSPEQLHDLLVHTLGNLTLTAQNATLSNNPFSRKQEIYEASSLQMNQEIADAPGWGKAQIAERAASLAERAIRLWPGPLAAGSEDGTAQKWALLRTACSQIPAGAWATYGDLAELIGSHPVPVGGHLASQPVPNAWRVLTSDGLVSPQFHWLDGTDRDPMDVLASEGVSFVDGHADPAQRLDAADLASLVGMEVPTDPPEPAGETGGLDSEAGRRFLEQLGGAHPNAVEGVTSVVEAWTGFGGTVSFGRGHETSCFLNVAVGRSVTWPVAVYPIAGTIEVVFQHMRRRPVFDDHELRRLFRDRLAAAGASIPDAKLDLRPNVPIALITDASSRQRVVEALEWFAVTFARGVAAAEVSTDDDSFSLT